MRQVYMSISCCAELVGHPGAEEQVVEVVAVLLACRYERVAPPHLGAVTSSSSRSRPPLRSTCCPMRRKVKERAATGGSTAQLGGRQRCDRSKERERYRQRRERARRKKDRGEDDKGATCQWAPHFFFFNDKYVPF
ncbi:hypothetical protein [Oryza sativa Japonica Group]|uniref:Uncharacterized protein n=1 Tax=Oryza sativa subsp. japonica TaxID=39947 RepID=Q5JLG7_ORYSJ|nr:hypothetical protein [Oryza sativa Japonica Group]